MMVKAAMKLPKNMRLRIREQTTTKAVALYSPVFNALCGSELPMLLTNREPMIAAMIPHADSTSGKTMPAS